MKFPYWISIFILIRWIPVYFFAPIPKMLRQENFRLVSLFHLFKRKIIRRRYSTGYGMANKYSLLFMLLKCYIFGAFVFGISFYDYKLSCHFILTMPFVTSVAEIRKRLSFANLINAIILCLLQTVYWLHRRYSSPISFRTASLNAHACLTN